MTIISAPFDYFLPFIQAVPSEQVHEQSVLSKIAKVDVARQQVNKRTQTIFILLYDLERNDQFYDIFVVVG